MPFRAAGVVSQEYRAQVVNNPAQTAAVTATGGNTANGTVTLQGAQQTTTLQSTPATGQPVARFSTVLNLAAGDSVTLTGGTPETLTVLSINPTTGDVTFTANIANASHTGAQWNADPTGLHEGMLLLLYGGGNPEQARIISVSGNVVTLDRGVPSYFTFASWGYGVLGWSSAKVTNATAGGNTATFANLYGLRAGVVVTMQGGTGENLTVQSVNYATGVVTFTGNILNANHTAAYWSYPCVLTDDFMTNGNQVQTPTQPTQNQNGAYMGMESPQTANITATGTQGATTATLDNTQGLSGNETIQLMGGTPENIEVQSINFSTGVVTFKTPIQNTGHTTAQWSSGGNRVARAWDHQLRQRGVQT